MGCLGGKIAQCWINLCRLHSCEGNEGYFLDTERQELEELSQNAKVNTWFVGDSNINLPQTWTNAAKMVSKITFS